jgi:hypothetical protein
MNYGPIVFLAAFFALASSWVGFVLAPQMQVGQFNQTSTVPAGAPYPLARPGFAREGLDVYRANGCAYCHSQQVGQTGTVCDILLTEAGTNTPALIAALVHEKVANSAAEAQQLLVGLPKTILQGARPEKVADLPKALSVGGAKAALWVRPVGPDIARGWGKRRTVAEDFLYDSPVMPGSLRVGPDLANVGSRSDANWHLRHLYSPTKVNPGSTMPPYRFLFEVRRIAGGASPDALPPDFAPAPGYEVVPTPAAKALVAYLLSLRNDEPLFVAPLSVAAPVTTTNEVAATTNSPATNAPAK